LSLSPTADLGQDRLICEPFDRGATDVCILVLDGDLGQDRLVSELLDCGVADVRVLIPDGDPGQRRLIGELFERGVAGRDSSLSSTATLTRIVWSVSFFDRGSADVIVLVLDATLANTA